MSHTTRSIGGGSEIELQRAIRVEDYLNDKLQTTADLSNIDALLADAQTQQGLLEAQVCPSTSFQSMTDVCSSLRPNEPLKMPQPHHRPLIRICMNALKDFEGDNPILTVA